MLITDQFVIINYPKTGTTFMRSVLTSIHKRKDTFPKKLMRKLGLSHPPMRKLVLPKLYGDYPPSFKDQHCVYRQIPLAERKKIVVSIVRNPLTKYISSYVFGWWKNHPPFSLSDVKKFFPKFPDLSFVEFYQLLNHDLVNEDKLRNPEARRLGSYTRMFLVFFAVDPEEAAEKVLAGQELNEILPPMLFLHQEFLRDDIISFLENLGYSKTDIAQVRQTENMNVGAESKKNSIPLEDLAKVATAILKDDKALLGAFPEYHKQVVAISERGALDQMPTNGFTGPRKLGQVF